MTMFPPIWVAAWASQRSRNGRFRKTSSAPPSAAAGRRVAGGAVPPRPSRGARAGGPTAALRAGSPRRHEPDQPALEGPPLDEDVPAAVSAAQPDVGAEPVDEPVVAAARMGAPEPDDVAEVAASSGGPRPSSGRGYQNDSERGWPWSGTRSRVEAGRVIGSSSAATSTAASGFVAASWAMIPPARVSDPTSVSGRADRPDRERVAERRSRRRRASPATPPIDRARRRPGRPRSRSPRRRRCGAR